MIDKTIIIGHGPSLINSGKGEYIDSYRYVIRFPYIGNWQAPEDYGSETTHICATSWRMRRRDSDIPGFCYYIWGKRKNTVLEEFSDLTMPVIDETDLVMKWERKLGKVATYARLSHGSASALIAMARIKRPVVLIGCDMLKIGESDKKKYIGSHIYENRRQNKSHHDFKIERELVDEMSKRYRVPVEFE